MPLSWSPGDAVLVQEVWNGRVWAADPMTVVRDDGNSVALWAPKGTPWKGPAPPNHLREATRGDRLATLALVGDWELADRQWELSTLVLMREGDWHAVWITWDDDGRQHGWKVNLQQPYRRTPCGLETMDLMLDVVIELDRSWRWKDEDELDLFVARGVFDPSVAERIRDEGLRVAERAERGEPPFDGAWADWRPDPSWDLPALPMGWDRLCR